jgi:hypothetical protein
MALVQRGSGVWGDGGSDSQFRGRGGALAIPVVTDNAARFGSVASCVPGMSRACLTKSGSWRRAAHQRGP